MKIAINPDKIGAESFSEKWAEFLKKRNVEVKWVNLSDIDVIDKIRDCDGVMWRWIHIPRDKIKAYQILHSIEYYLGIPVFPNHNTCWSYDNKITQQYMFNATGISTPKTWVFWDRDEAIQWAKNTEFPKIFKLASGASSSNVLKIDSPKEAVELIDRIFLKGIFPCSMNEFEKKIFPPKSFKEIKYMLSRIKYGFIYSIFGNYPPLSSFWWQPEKGYVYFQEFIPDNAYDTRITVIGKRAFGFVRYNRDGEFRASGSGKVDYDVSKINREIIKLAFKISDILKTQSIAFDFLIDNGKILVTEMSYTFVDRAIFDCPGYWRDDMTWAEGHMWPEEAQVEDFIEHVKEAKKNKK